MSFNYNPVKAEILPRETVNGHRVYRCGSHVYPSVTTVLSIEEKKELNDWRERVGEEEATLVSRRSTARGRRIHDLCESYLKNEPVIPTMFDREIWNTLNPILNNIQDICGLEVPLYSKHLKVAGTADCIGHYLGKRSLIDFKTSTRQKYVSEISSYFMQAAAYAVMWEERYNQPITNLVIIIATDDAPTSVFTAHRDNWINDFIKLRGLFEKKYGF